MPSVNLWLNQLDTANGNLQAFIDLIQCDAALHLENMARTANRLTQMNFGKTIQLFAPLYLSNECVNTCHYCGFSAPNKIRRRTLLISEVTNEAQYLYQKGFQNILLVSGEDPKAVSVPYLEQNVQRLHQFIPSLSLEVAPLETEEYLQLRLAGTEGIVVYQETYNRHLYKELHPRGKKKDYQWRLEALERASQAGIRRLGAGILLGLDDWRSDSIELFKHIQYLLKTCWKSFITISLPRIKPAAGDFEPLTHITDKEFIQLILAFRICLPQIGIVLSTRENPVLRNHLIPLGITHMSAGSKTDPGGYLTSDQSEPQFYLEDIRSAQEVAAMIQQKGYEAVWKNWEFALT